MESVLDDHLIPLNTSQPAPTSFPFTLLAPPRTDLHPSPRPVPYSPHATFEIPTTQPAHSANQPTFYVTMKPSQFVRASLTFSFQPKAMWDQAGLVLLYGSSEKKWVKAGLVMSGGYRKPMAMVETSNGKGNMVCMESPPVDDSIDSTGEIKTRMEMKNGESGKGFFVEFGGIVYPEFNWDFSEEDEEVKVGFYAARPLGENKGNLEVVIDGWDVEMK